MEEVGVERKRRIKLYCPPLSKTIQLIIASEEQKLDLGSIARVFGLDPNTLKLNGHFISRGVDFIASSVTWRSLFGFFSARGFSTGDTDSNALVVDGKLSKVGSKRSYDLEDSENAIYNSKDKSDFRDCKKAHCSSSLKRKLSSEDECFLKRMKSDEAVSGDLEGGSISRFSCSLFNKNMKRMRDDDMVAVSPLWKNIR